MASPTLLQKSEYVEWTRHPARWEGDRHLMPATSPPKQVPASLPVITAPTTQERQLATRGFGTQAVESGLPGPFEAEEGERKSERQETTQGDCAQSPPQPSATTSHAAPETDRHRFSKAQPVR